MVNNESEAQKLREAFDSLNLSTEKLSAAYLELKSEAVRLNDDLEESKDFLSGILNGLNCGVVAAGPEGEVILANPEAKRLNAGSPDVIKKWLKEMTGPGGSITAPKKNFQDDEGRLFGVSLSRLGSGEGEESGFIFVIEDVTELERLRKQHLRSEKLAAIGKVAAGMAHEVRNPLGGMEIFASLLRRELEGDEDKLKLLGHVTTGMQSINNVISNFLLFTKELKPVKKVFDLHKLVTDVLEFAKYVFEQNNIDVSVDLPDGPAAVNADENLVRQVLLNMIHNAAGAMPDGGSFRVELKLTGSGTAEQRAEIVCSDTGHGVPEEIREKIFDPFFTTKDSGAGLGLSIVSQIAQAHGGYADLLEGGGPGAKFIISIPQ